MNLTQYELGYIAGFFDGEGCVYYNGSHRYCQVNIGQQNPAILNWIESRIGGSVYRAGANYWIWKKSAVLEVLEFLKLLEPYCIGKNVDIRLGIAHCEAQIAKGKQTKKIIAYRSKTA